MLRLLASRWQNLLRPALLDLPLQQFAHLIYDRHRGHGHAGGETLLERLPDENLVLRQVTLASRSAGASDCTYGMPYLDSIHTHTRLEEKVDRININHLLHS